MHSKTKCVIFRSVRTSFQKRAIKSDFDKNFTNTLYLRYGCKFESVERCNTGFSFPNFEGIRFGLEVFSDSEKPPQNTLADPGGANFLRTQPAAQFLN